MRTGLSKKILVPILGIIALGLAAVLVVQYLNARLIIRQELTKRLDREVHLSVKLIDSWLQARVTDIVAWSRQEVLAEALTEGGYYGRSAREGAESLLTTLKAGYPQYESLFLADRQGEIVAVSAPPGQPPMPVRLADRAYFQRALEGKASISEVLVSRLSAQKTFTCAAPIAVDGHVIGVLGGVIDFAVFKALFLEDFKVKQHGYAFVVDYRQQVLGSSRDNEQTLAESVPADFFQRIFAEPSGMFNVDTHDDEILTVFQRLQQTDWAFAIAQSVDNTLLPLRRIAQVSTVGAAVALLVISLLVIALFRKIIIARLQEMLRVIVNVQSGDFSQRIVASPCSRPDELTELTGSFNTMIAQLNHSMTELNEEIRVRKQTEATLAHHQENLEKIIEQRGAALEKEIRERQQVEERLVRAEKLEMIGTLAGGVAHDLNNILSGIVSYPDLLLMKLPQTSPLYAPLRTIKESGEKAAAIVQDLLTLARRGVTVKEPVLLNALIGDYLASPEFSLLQQRHPRIRVITDCAPDLFPVLGSPVHLEKTIMNLVTNAAEAMEGGGEIRLRTENRYVDNSLRLYEKIGQGEYVVLEVSDQGSGIRPEDLDKIFEPFYTSKKMGKSGTGLGMAVVWGTVKDHQGYINCESQVGVGSTFTLFFPVTSHQSFQRQVRTTVLDACRGQGEHILVVDDIVEQREIASSILRELGYQVTTVASGEEAVRLVARQRFDLVLLDMILGEGMDGLDTYQSILVHAPGQRAIITSGFSETERIAQALQLGVGQYIKKPYMIAKLGRAIREELTRGQTAQ
ncbi:integral membrane sensor hybrid histidine kinase [Desulfobulbus propionicus DSM 2032]|uniref:histidine kinase n=1 Tax=Desulfobulbus propionicus (strain ATCC 33891 / DSM 2032 / VKM B-1956 / 1pr3) TaxID=577650 RepID=A0A7U4DMJ5_DESPD|nr:ATP-binding protein [Desulfobulbus propionicus]ADW16246.1 integral membrane sensor hybrid histidine kinase [Desulfobulbus propionicus DSM 2032]